MRRSVISSIRRVGRVSTRSNRLTSCGAYGASVWSVVAPSAGVAVLPVDSVEQCSRRLSTMSNIPPSTIKRQTFPSSSTTTATTSKDSDAVNSNSAASSSTAASSTSASSQFTRPTPPPPPASTLTPLNYGQFRISIREVPSFDVQSSSRPLLSALRDPNRGKSVAPDLVTKLQPALAEPVPRPRRLREATEDSKPPPSSHVQRSRLVEWLVRQFGYRLWQRSENVLRSLQTQARRPEWFGENGALQPTSMTQIQLESLHLWLLHVRLRTEFGANEKFIRSLFDLFWSTQRAFILGETVEPNESNTKPTHHLPPGMTIDSTMSDLTKILYGSWLALDRGLDKSLRAITDQAATEPPTDAFRATAKFNLDPSRINLDAHDFMLLGALYRNLYQGDQTRNPYHLALMYDYVIQSIEHLYQYSTEAIMSNEFEWLTPPSNDPSICPSMSPIPTFLLTAYYTALSRPPVEEPKETYGFAHLIKTLATRLANIIRK